MPRDGSGIYSQPFPNVVEGTTIESAVYNGYTTDVTIDLNTPRPIAAGGTGANNAHDAMVALGGEIAKQLVANYDAFPFAVGSFYSLAGATAAPTVNAFSGICYGTDDNNMVLEARDVTDNKLYIRRKAAGTWAAWVAEETGYDARFVNVGGDTMTGTLHIQGNVPILALDKTAVDGTSQAAFVGRKNGLDRWTLRLGNDTAETGSNAGSNFDILANNDAGAGAAVKLSISRATGSATFAETLTTGSHITANGYIMTAQSPTTGAINFGTSGTKYLQYDGTNFNLIGASLLADRVHARNDIMTSNSGGANNGTLYFGQSGTSYITYQGGGYGWTGGTVTISGGLLSTSNGYIMARNPGVAAVGCHNGGYGYIMQVGGDNNLRILSATAIGDPATPLAQCGQTGGWNFAGNVVLDAGMAVFTTNLIASGTSTLGIINASGRITSTQGYLTRAGIGGATLNLYNIYWTGGGTPQARLWIDSTDVGQITLTSDYRTKKDVVDLPAMWDTVKALRPIKYTAAEFSPPSQQAYAAKQKAAGEYEDHGPLFPASDIEQWGFIAHELQETLTPSAATGEKDSPDIVQSPNPFTLIAALTKALQEAMARIEALEAR